MPRATTAPGEPATEVRTFLFADVRGYTRFTHERGDEAAAALVARLVTVARQRIESRGGAIVEIKGDEVFAAFSSARQALRAAVELQQELGVATQGDPSLPLTVGMGLDAGEAVRFQQGYRGSALNLASRLCALAGAGEVLTTEAVVHLAGRTEGLEYVERGLADLKGFVNPVTVIEVRAADTSAASGDQITAAEPSPSGTPAIQETRRNLPIGGFLGALPQGVLVARDAELASILQLMTEVTAGQGRLVLLAGEPGIGKTRLAQEASLEARNRSFTVITGRCYELEGSVPFLPFLEALRAAREEASARLRAEISHRWPQLDRLLPQRSAPEPSGASDREEEQQRLFWAVTGFLQELARERPLALLLDDIHWADDSSLKLLQHLARHTRADRVLLLATYRDVDVGRGHPLERARLDLHREQLLTQIDVDSLSEVGTAALIESTVTEPELAGELAAILYPHTDGNPFFVGEVLRALIENGDLYRDHTGWKRRDAVEVDVPENVRSVIRQRLTRLSPAGQEILHEATVLGQTFTFESLQLLASKDELTIESALEEAMDAGLVREWGVDEYGFNHSLTHHALYTEIPSRRRRRLHLLAADLAERSPANERGRRAAELAWHFLEGGESKRALPYVLLAGDAAFEVFAHTEAEFRYRSAVDLAAELDETPRQGEALEKLGRVLRTTARFDEALETLERAALVYRQVDDGRGEGRVVAEIGIVHHVRGTPKPGITRLCDFLTSLPGDRETPLLEQIGPTLYVALANLYMLDGDNSQSLTAGEKAWTLAESVGNDRIQAEVGVVRGTSLLLLGRQSDALAVLQETIPRAEAASDVDSLSLALDALSDIALARGDLHDCAAYRRRALELFDRMGDPAKIAYGLATLGIAEFYLGMWTTARERFEKAIELSRSLGSSRIAAYPLLGLGMDSLGRGDVYAARVYLEECVAICERTGSPEALTYGQRLLAECDLEEARPEVARTRLTSLLEHAGVAQHNVPHLLATLAEAYLAIHDDAHAQKMIGDALRRARDADGKLALVDALRVEGLLATRREAWNEATVAFREAGSRARDMAYPQAEARILQSEGVMQLMAGNPEQSTQSLQRALQLFMALGAEREITRTKELLNH